MTTLTSTSSSTAAGAPSASSATGAGTSAQEMGDKFLKLLVTQLKNQDPLNPMDNAQLTSQMAQVNTVSGIEKLNDSVKALGTQFLQAQTLQGAAMIGRQVWVEGNRLLPTDGVARGGFDLAASAQSVKVEVLDAGDRVVDTLNLGMQAAGRGRFEWKVPSGVDGSQLKFRVVATSGAAGVAAQPLSVDAVSSVSTTPNGLSLGLSRLGEVDFSKVKVVS
jgi:flagellar basal-body rod modification protein FlgD